MKEGEMWRGEVEREKEEVPETRKKMAVRSMEYSVIGASPNHMPFFLK